MAEESGKKTIAEKSPTLLVPLEGSRSHTDRRRLNRRSDVVWLTEKRRFSGVFFLACFLFYSSIRTKLSLAFW